MALFKKMFDQSVGGKGVLKSELSDKFTALKFLRLTKRKFFRLCGINVLFILMNLPAVAILLYLAGYGTVAQTTPLYPFWFGPVYGASQIVKNPAASLLYSLCSITVQGSYPGTWSYILLAIACLTFFTFGFSNTGMAYMLRNYTREEPCDFKDFFGAIKRNFVQALLFGIIDLLILCALAVDIFLFFTGNGTPALFAVIGVASGVIYLIMRNYFYTILITFDLSIIKIIKNSLIFAFVNVKRNLCGFLVNLISWILLGVLVYFATPVGVLLVIGVFFAFNSFVGIYTAYPAIKQYMIDPIIEQERKKKKEENKGEKESIFQDMG